MVNWIPDLNRFQLAGPPNWWLKQLFHFDDSLVVLPSRMGFYYRLAQKRPPDPRADIVLDAMKNDGDTRMLSQYGLIPVTTILSTANWSNPLLFEELRKRAPWRMGGADKVIKDIEDHEAKVEFDKRAKMDEFQTALSKDGWNLYKKKIGLQSHMYIPRSKERSYKESKSPLIKISK